MSPAADPDRVAALAALGLEVGASAQDILSAYRRLARASHPDTAPGEFPNSEFARVNAAYRYLTTSGPPAGGPSSVHQPPDVSPDLGSPSPEWDAQYRWPDEPQVVAGPVIIRPLPPEAP
jgi:curved DNA-binding protein CbpA